MVTLDQTLINPILSTHLDISTIWFCTGSSSSEMCSSFIAFHDSRRASNLAPQQLSIPFFVTFFALFLFGLRPYSSFSSAVCLMSLTFSVSGVVWSRPNPNPCLCSSALNTCWILRGKVWCLDYAAYLATLAENWPWATRQERLMFLVKPLSRSPSTTMREIDQSLLTPVTLLRLNSAASANAPPACLALLSKITVMVEI